jgi:hypothetical protein
VNDFWNKAVQPELSEAELPRADGAAYRAHRRLESASGIYNEPVRPQARPKIYQDSQYQGLESYTSKPVDKLDRRSGESTEGWRRRVLAVARALPEDEVASRLAAIDQADAQERPKTGEELHAMLAARQSGVDRGILGGAYDRAAVLGSRGFGSGREVAANGGVGPQPLSAARPLSMAAINMIMQEREAERTQQQPQRTQVPTGASGIGWSVARG